MKRKTPKSNGPEIVFTPQEVLDSLVATYRDRFTNLGFGDPQIGPWQMQHTHDLTRVRSVS